MSFLDLLFPKRCVGCRKQGSYFCIRCQGLAKLQFPQVCPVCERNSIGGITHKWCRKKGYVPEGLFSVWVYEGVLRKLIWKLKYKFVSDMALEIAKAAMVQKWPEWLEQEFVVVPVPLHWVRQNWRGFNHAEEIARQIAGRSGSRMENLLTRSKYTASQVGKSEDERKKNIAGVFKLNDNVAMEQSSNILLFDDVWTSGATLLEATRVLKRAGFKKVWCLTLAR